MILRKKKSRRVAKYIIIELEGGARESKVMSHMLGNSWVLYGDPMATGVSTSSGYKIKHTQAMVKYADD